MNTILFGTLGVLMACVGTLSTQAPATAANAASSAVPARKPGTIYKDEVDTLVDVLTDLARAKGAALGGDSVVATAKILTAMSRCHRRYYYPGDVPSVTRSVEYLIRQRQQDGSFGDADATAWAVEALQKLPLEPMFRDEVAQAQKWLAAKGAQPASLEQLTSGVLASVRADVFPQDLGKEASGKVKAWFATPSDLATGEAADALLQLVACQTANKALDRAQAPQGQAATPPWTPAQEKAFVWLMKQQNDGVFSASYGGKTFPDPAMTGFGIYALQSKPKAARSAAEQAAIDKGVKWLLGSQNADGTWGQQVPNYTTCVVVGALVRAEDPAAAPLLAKAQKAILGFQNIEAGGYQRSDRDYGSIGYGSAQRGDLSNLHFSIEALRATGLPENHEALQKALVFLQRTQNLKSVNDFSGKVPDPEREGVVLDATSGDDGGAAYYPGNSNAGYIVQPDGKSVPRSYGSMTYALLKSYTLAGVRGDDPRVQAAIRWIQDNWTLAVNPGTDPAMGEKVRYAGLFYYYMVLAQALELAKVTTVKAPVRDAKGEVVADDKGNPKTKDVDWRKELRAHLESIQQADGTWVNGKNERWMEGSPLLCTCYAMSALERCK
jgi:hypothetical protein